MSKLPTSVYNQIIDGIKIFLETIPVKVDNGLYENESISTGEKPPLTKLTAKIQQIRNHWHAYAINKLETQNKLAAKFEYTQTQI